MSVFLHAIVWIDPSEATVSRFRGNVESDVDVHSHAPLQKLHHLRTGWEAGGRLADRDNGLRLVSFRVDLFRGARCDVAQKVPGGWIGFLASFEQRGETTS